MTKRFSKDVEDRIEKLANEFCTSVEIDKKLTTIYNDIDINYTTLYNYTKAALRVSFLEKLP